MNPVLKRRAIHGQQRFGKRADFSDDIHEIRVKDDDDLHKDSESRTIDECSECEELLDNDDVSSSLIEDDSPHKTEKRKYTNICDRRKQNQTTGNTLKYLLILISFGVVLVIFYFYSPFTNKVLDCEQIPSCSFLNRYKRLQGEFQNQNRLSWKVIRSAINSVINSTRHDQPAVILLVASKQAREISSCLAHGLANVLEESYNDPKGYPKLHKIKGITDSEMKERIDVAFKESFENSHHHVIVLERLDTFAAESAMILHSYCDHENAPYKDVVILMTAATNASVTDSEGLTLRKMDQIAWKHLDSTWKMQLQEEKRIALLSRITTSVALVFPEDTVPPFCAKYYSNS